VKPPRPSAPPGGARKAERNQTDYKRLATEAPNPRARDLEAREIEEIVTLLVREEAHAHRAALKCRKEIARAAALVIEALKGGGRLFYVGAGTSGRLGALDAAELPPTFGSDPGQVVALLAGGPRAMQRSVEGAEDRGHTAARRLARHGAGPHDVVCAIAASGVTPFARAALVAARERGARTIFVTCVSDPTHAGLADVVIAASVGPEVLAGSTRLKAGTATKIILNAISTTTMMKLGKVYRGRMVDVVASNHKLKDRARRIVAEITGVSDRAARALLQQAGGRPKVAIAMSALSVPAAEARSLLAANGDDLHRLFAQLDRRGRPRSASASRPRTRPRPRPRAARRTRRPD
jgi:N-acetylmuramic acid 6-phosphate etherase